MEATTKIRMINSLKDEEVAKRESAVVHSLHSLLEALYELQEVEQMVNRPGLTQRVCLSVSDILMDFMRYARTCYKQAD